MTTGRHLRLSRVFGSGFALILPIDDGLISGPQMALQRPEELLLAASEVATAVLGYPAALVNWAPSNGLARIANLTASTSLSEPLRKVQVASLTSAVHAGADAVAAHINFGSPWEGEMMQSASKIFEEAHRFGLPTVAISYVRDGLGDSPGGFVRLAIEDPDRFGAHVMHAARASVELGADVVKIQPISEPSQMQAAVTATSPARLLLAGGAAKDDSLLADEIDRAKRAGFAGVAPGRNIHQTPDPSARLRWIGQLIK
jgi:fructose-bisphosphate aldolase / 2-amino-3,7-dideoxy-D-threo-hept-6-ulosonate synthase